MYMNKDKSSTYKDIFFNVKSTYAIISSVGWSIPWALNSANAHISTWCCSRGRKGI